MRAIATMLSLALATGTVAAQEAKLRLAHPVPVGSSIHKWAERFTATVERLSGGTIKAEVIGGGVLGGPPEMLAQGRTGKLDLWLLDPVGLMLVREARPFAVMFAPFLFRDQDHYAKFVASELFQSMMADAETKVGVKFVGILGDRAPRALLTRNRPIRTPADLKGLKVRVPQLPFVAAAWRAWGASPTPLTGADLYQAMQSGLVDGDDNGIDIVNERGLGEVAKHFTPLNYVHSSIGIFMSGELWAKYDAKQRAWFTEAATVVRREQPPYAAMIEQEYARAKAKGIVVVEPDLGEFRAAAAKVIEEFDGKMWPAGLYKKIQDIR
jgi:TRAP-type C4-dicarboxylate transport system substrate-binding protein